MNKQQRLISVFTLASAAFILAGYLFDAQRGGMSASFVVIGAALLCCAGAISESHNP